MEEKSISWIPSPIFPKIAKRGSSRYAPESRDLICASGLIRREKCANIGNRKDSSRRIPGARGRYELDQTQERGHECPLGLPTTRSISDSCPCPPPCPFPQR